jgi:Ca2+-binding EF-hand superfamily protein
MGGGKSKYHRGNWGSSDADCNFLMDQLQLNHHDIQRLIKSFKKFDLGKDGLVQYDEFCSRMRCEPTELLRTLFAFFGSPGQEERSNPVLNFAEFCLFVTQFLTLNERNLIEFLFIVMTCTKDDRVPAATVSANSLGDAMRLLLANTDHRKLMSFLKKMSDNEEGKLYVTKANFVEAVLSHNKSIIFPFVSYQLDATKRVVGKGFWNNHTNTFHNRILTVRYQLQQLLESETAAAQAIDINV